MRKHAEIIALLLLAVIIVAAVSLAQRDDEQTGSPRQTVHSSYQTLPEGYRALSLTLRELHYPVTQQIRPYAMLPDEGFLIVTDPFRTNVSEYEGRKLVEWISRGNYALVTLEYHPEFLADLEGDAATKNQKGAGHDGAPTSPLDEYTPPEAYGKTIVATDKATTAGAVGKALLLPSAPALTVRSTFRFTDAILPKKLKQLVGGAKPIYHDANGIVAAYSQIGAGGIVWCCSPWSFSNQGLSEGKNLDFLLALADKRPGGPVIFDEYHNGYGAGMSVWSLAPRLTKLGMLQLGAALLVLCVLLAWRFGPHRLPAEERFTRSRAEYLTSMASLLHRAQATHLVRERLGHLLHREVGRRLGVPPQAPVEQILQANAGDPIVDHAGLERVLQQLSTMKEQQHPDQEAMLRLSTEIHRLLHRKSS